MADPITIATTLITFASFIEDLINLGQSIKQSIEKVRDNRRRSRDLADDILHTLAGLDTLRRTFGTKFYAPELLHALGDLKADMIYVLSVARRLSPAERNHGFRGFGSRVKAWIRRDDIGVEIQRLKEHVNKCYIQFTVFSTARNEHTSLRVEQALIVNNVENQVRLQRLETLMGRVLLNTPFGESFAHQTMEIISSDPAHQTLESQYLSSQAMRLFASLQKLVTANSFLAETSFYDPQKPIEVIFVRPVPPAHVLHMVLGLVLQISNGSVQISMAVISHHLDCIGEYLSLLGMHSEATAAGIMSTNILRLLARGNSSVAPCLALALDNLSRRYCHQMRCDLALQASQQSLDLCYNCSESSPDVDNRPLFLAALITHSSNLRLAGIPDAAISIAQEAVIVSQLILTKLVGLFTTKSGAQLVRPQDKWTAAKCCAAFFTLASAYSSAGRYYEAFLASQEGLETVVKFSGAVLAPIASDVDTAIDLLCRMAEAGELSRATLADNVVMFRNLARIYLEEFASPFLSILHAHVYFRGQADPSSHVPNELRIFLEPNPDSQPPLLVVLSDPATAIEDFNGVVEDAVYAFYASSVTFVEATSSLIQCFFISHFDRATMVLRKVGASLIANPSVSPGVLAGAVIEIFDTLQLVSHSEQSSLLEVMTDLIRHLCTLVGSQQASWKTRQHFTFALSSYFCIAWLGGRLDEALVLTYEAIKCLRSGSDNEEGDEELCDWLLCRSFILFDLGRFPEAAGVLQDIADDDIRRYTFVNFYHSLVRSRILRQFGKADEALHLLSERTSAVYPQYRENYGLLIELADIHLDLGNSRQALRDAERVVALYRASPIELISSQAEHVKYALARALNSLSNCLAAVGRNEEGLLAVQEAAALILPLNRTPLPIAWSTVLLRPQELAAITLCTLSLRLAALGNTQEALLNVQEAVNLCRELVLLAVRHKPFLASTLKNLSTQLWNVGRRDEAIAALKEVSALDNVDEP